MHVNGIMIYDDIMILFTYMFLKNSTQRNIVCKYLVYERHKT